MKNPEKKKVGMVGSNEVVLYGDAHCLILGKQWLSIGKIKAVLANLEAAKAFLLKYDVQEAPTAPVVSLESAKEKEALLKKMAALQAQVAQLSAQNNGHTNRIDPVQKAA